MPIYLDYNATAPLHPVIRAKMAALPAIPMNPSSAHRYGREARKYVEHAKTLLLDVLGASAEAYHVIWTASASEANNVLLRGVAYDCLLYSAIEHPSVLKLTATLPNAMAIPVTAEGCIDLAAYESLLQAQAGKKILVSIMWANNETGVIQPIAEAIALAQRYGAWVHSDAVQAFGKLPMDLQAVPVDALTLAAHKVGGPVGVAALLIRKSIVLQPLVMGGGQQLGLHAGTENVPAIIGMGEVCTLLPELLAHQQSLALWRDEMEAALQKNVPSMTIFGQASPRLSNTSCMTMPGVSSETQVIGFDMAEIAVSAGSACSSGRIGHSHVLTAMGADAQAIDSSLRVSLGYATTCKEIEQFTQQWQQMHARLDAAEDRRDRRYA